MDLHHGLLSLWKSAEYTHEQLVQLIMRLKWARCRPVEMTVKVYRSCEELQRSGDPLFEEAMVLDLEFARTGNSLADRSGEIGNFELIIAPGVISGPPAQNQQENGLQLFRQQLQGPKPPERIVDSAELGAHPTKWDYKFFFGPVSIATPIYVMYYARIDRPTSDKATMTCAKTSDPTSITFPTLPGSTNGWSSVSVVTYPPSWNEMVKQFPYLQRTRDDLKRTYSEHREMNNKNGGYQEPETGGKYLYFRDVADDFPSKQSDSERTSFDFCKEDGTVCRDQ